MHLSYLTHKRAHTVADDLNQLFLNDAAHALDVANATFHVGVTHLPVSCTGLSRPKKPWSAQALSLRRRCSSFREGRGRAPKLLELKWDSKT